MKVMLGIVIGIILGVGVTLISNHLVRVSYVPDEFEYKELLSLSAIKISDDKFHCENTIIRSVGSVLGVIYRSNANGHLNRINEKCSEGVCQITYSSCKPWGNDGCGSTTLSFKVSESGKIYSSTFRCLQVP